MRQIQAFVVDSDVHQRLLTEAFRVAGQPVQLEMHGDAASAWAAIERLRFLSPEQWPEFAVVDIGLPGASGIELVDRIRQARHLDDWPVVILTASKDPDDRAEALLAKATGYYVKPSSGAGYVALVRDLLRDLGYHAARPKESLPKAAPPTKSDPR
jgi:CheY-like chemotaxis protein